MYYKNLIQQIILLTILSTSILLAQVDTAWIRRYNGFANLPDAAQKITVDAVGNVYVTGISRNLDNLNDCVTIKYNSLGETLWTRRYNGPDSTDDYVCALAVDGSSNVYIAGTSRKNFSYKCLTIKYSEFGDTLWTRRYIGPDSNDHLNGLAIDAFGNVYVTGTSLGFGSGNDYLTIKYNSLGDTVWTRRYHKGYENGRAIGVDSSGNIYVTGTSQPYGARSAYLTIKYNALGDTIWTRRYNGPNNSPAYAVDLAVDLSGNVSVTGFTYFSSDSKDYLTVKYNSAGDLIWANTYNGAYNANDEPKDIAVDRNGNTYVTGFCTNLGNNCDFATIKYNSSGDTVWIRHYNSSANQGDLANAIAVDAMGNAYVTGISLTGISYYSDIVTIKYNPFGDVEWIQIYDGPANMSDHGNDIIADNLGNVYVTGRSVDNTSGEDYVTIKYTQVINYYLTLTTNPLGITTPNGEGLYYANSLANISTTSPLSITPYTYFFAGWTTEDMTEINDQWALSTTVLMDKTKTVTANYQAMNASTTAKGIGFWSNKNGQQLLTLADAKQLRPLPPYIYSQQYPKEPKNTRPFDTLNLNTFKRQIKDFLLNANATDMRYMLAAQLLATKLNILHGFLNADQEIWLDDGNFIYEPGENMTIYALINNALVEWSSGTRPSQENVKNLLDKINNNLLWFVAGQSIWCANPLSKFNNATMSENTTASIFSLNVFPNPFSQNATIRYTIPNSDRISIKLYNSAGRLINTLVDKYQLAGTYALNIDIKKLNIPKGIYFLRFQNRANIKEAKLIVQ